MLPDSRSMAGLHPYLRLEHPLRFAHRGSRILWPENTMVAFQGAVDLGYRYIETDVRMSQDRQVVVFHDRDLERLTNGRGRVVDHTLEELRDLDAGYNFDATAGFPHRGSGLAIPTLEEVLTTWPDVHFNVDLKASGTESAVADLVAKLDRHDSVLIASFVDRRVAKFRRITGGRVATSAGPAAAAAVWAASRLGRSRRLAPVAYQVPFDSRALRLDHRFVAAAHAVGAQVHAWTVNDAGDMKRLLAMGVDGIVTDRPDVLNDVVAGAA